VKGEVGDCEGGKEEDDDGGSEEENGHGSAAPKAWVVVPTCQVRSTVTLNPQPSTPNPQP